MITLAYALILATAVQGAVDVGLISGCGNHLTSCIDVGHESSVMNSCCAPNHGLVVLEQKWTFGPGPSDKFVISGLEARTCTGKAPPMDGCNPDRKVEHLDGFMKNADPDLHEYIQKYWSVDDFKSSPFWEHAWLRHGTCMTNLGPECRGNVGGEYNDVLGYFRIAKALHEQFDIMQVLTDNGVPPGTSLPLPKLQRILEDAFSVKVNIHCSNSVLDGVQLWFKTRGGVQFEPVDSVDSSSCNAKMITFPLKQ
ncbi:hypothetical protein H4R34_004373 [Dimargaris verticillata]|uniref:Uncharacterized protein n=1 Tax=Dimargaris verticillata TaxID=2761393 RepID=A0A9W8ECA4_9FUNG|nr:hypothetical protein H4R34_004373 [Dimargaris verticillata]